MIFDKTLIIEIVNLTIAQKQNRICQFCKYVLEVSAFKTVRQTIIGFKSVDYWVGKVIPFIYRLSRKE